MNCFKNDTQQILCLFKKDKSWTEKQYYAEDTHDPIISREVFRKAQELLKRKSERHGHQNNGQYTFTSLIVCDECGTNFCRRIAKTNVFCGPVASILKGNICAAWRA